MINETQLKQAMAEQLQQFEKSLNSRLDEQLMKFYKLLHGEIQELRGDTDARFNKIDSKIDQLYDLNDSVLKRLETQEQERLTMSYQLDKHESWYRKNSH